MRPIDSMLSSSRKRREWLLRLILMIGAPTLVFALFEITLRLFGYGYPTNFFIKNPVPGRHSLVENRDFSRRYFPPELARVPHSLEFLPTKPPKTLRIFIFGESAAEGDPAPSFGFARILQIMLREHCHELNIEVINTAVTAINSHVIRPIAREAADYPADVWIIYMGNNEVVGPFGSGTIFGAQSASGSFVRASLALKATRFGQLFDNTLSHLTSSSRPHEWAGMEMFLKQQVRANDPRMRAVYQHFERNLSDIIGFGVQSGAKVIVSTVGSNLRDCPPFASLHQADFSDEKKVEWQRLYDAGIALAREGKPTQAVAEFQRAAVLDDQFAELHFRLARCCAALGHVDEARRHFSLARDLDTLRFRADSRLNETIRRVVQEWPDESVSLLDAEQALARESSDGIPGEESFYEHVHLTFSGNYVIARELAEQITKKITVAPPSFGTSNSKPIFLSRDECARRLALTDSDRLQIAMELSGRFNRPPFTQQFDHEAQRTRWNQIIAELYGRDRTNLLQTIAIYHDAIHRAESDWELRDNFAATLIQHGDQTNALAQWQRAAEILPHRVQTYDMIGNVLLESGNLKEAIACYREALNIDPDFPQGHIGLGRVYLAQKSGNEAIEEFRRGVALQPRWASTHNFLGTALLQAGRQTEAENEFRAAVAAQADFTPARLNLGRVLLTRGAVVEAMTNYQIILENDPANTAARIALGNVYATQGRMSAALQEFTEAVHRQPENFDARLVLAGALLSVNQQVEAGEHFAVAIRLRPSSVEARINYGGILANQGRKAEARAQVEEALRLQPTCVPAHVNLAIALLEEGDVQQAVSHLREAIRLDPQNSRARQLLNSVGGEK